jgi:hypothetical protein
MGLTVQNTIFGAGFDTLYLNSIIKNRVSHFGSVHVWFDSYTPLSEACLRELAAHCAEIIMPSRDLWKNRLKWRGKKKKKWIYSERWLRKAVFIRPTPTCLEILEKFRPHGYLINHLEINLELITPTQHQALWLKQFCDTHFLKRGVVVKPKSKENSPLSSPLNSLSFDFSCPKPRLSPATRESRLRIQAVIKREKVSQQGIITLEALQGFDHNRFWQENLLFYKMKTLEQVGRGVYQSALGRNRMGIKKRKKGKKQHSVESCQRVGIMFLRGYCQLDTQWDSPVTIQKVWQEGRGLSGKGLIEKLDNRLFLPSPL